MDWTRRAAIGGLAVTMLPLPTFAAAPTDGFVVLEASTSVLAGKGALRLLPPPAAETATWAYNGQVPGPLLRIKLGDEVRVRLVNRLPQPTSIAWHGVRLANAMDGVAGLTQKPVLSGESFDYRFTPPDAGLYIYHPHVFPHSAEQIGRGLYGILLVEEPEPPKVDQDLIVVLDDWSLDAKGQIAEGFGGTPRIGTLLTANAKPVPLAPTDVRPGARLRLRLVNVCAARIALVTVAGADPLVIAIDGQASEVFPPAANTLPIGPGARFEIVLDMPPDVGKTVTLSLRSETGASSPLMSFATKGQPIASRPRMARLPVNPLLPTRIPLEKSIKLKLLLGRNAPTKANSWVWTIDGVGSDGFSAKPLFRVKRGGAVTLAFVNETNVPQQMHVHGHVFRVLHDLDDGWDPYWRESILIGPGRTKHVAFIADNPGKWAVDSLFLDRQVSGMATWFEVS